MPCDARRADGMALVAVLLLAAAFGLVAALVLPVTDAELLIAASAEERERVRVAAEGGLALALGALQDEPDWTQVLAGARAAPWSRTVTILPAPDGATVDLRVERLALQQRTGALLPLGADTPVWVVYAGASFDALVPPPPGAPTSPALAIFVADDGGESDGRPAVDTNGVIVVRVDAFGTRGARQTVSATIERVLPAPANLRVLSRSEGG